MTQNQPDRIAYNYIREEISCRRLRPGAVIHEDAIAEAAQVPVEAVRTALLQLEQEGITVLGPNYSATIIQLSREELQQVYTARAMLEPKAFWRAVKRRSEQSVRLMEENLRQQEMLDTPLNMVEYAELNRDFHMIYIREIGSPDLEEALTKLYRKVMLYQLFWDSNTAEEAALETHRRILDAFREGDPFEGADAVRDDIVQAEARIREFQEL